MTTRQRGLVDPNLQHENQVLHDNRTTSQVHRRSFRITCHRRKESTPSHSAINNSVLVVSVNTFVAVTVAIFRREPPEDAAADCQKD